MKNCERWRLRNWPRNGLVKLLQQIGEGGFGVVYMAKQQRPVRRTVALKIIKPGMDTKEVIARFEAERQALAMMDHHNIARVLDAGATETGRPFFVMELVKGILITEYCNDQKLTPRERLELFVPVCHAIQHAHQKGIIHRDIKPSNVLVCLYDGKPVPKVIDFGVAKAIEQRLTEKTMFTRHGQVIGTLEYMSPEQAELSQLDIDTRSDVYSLGVLLYELLTGTTPITKDQLRQAGFTEMLRMIRETEPDRPSLRLSHSYDTLATISAQRRTEPAKLGALLRGEIDWIVMKTLEKDRTRRYDTANGLARDIDRYLQDEPVEACPPSVGYRLRKFTRRHRTGVFLTAFVAATVLALLFNEFIGRLELKKAWNRASAEAVRAQEAKQLALEELKRAEREKVRAEHAETAAQLERDRAVTAEQQTREQRDRAVAAEQEAVQQRELEAKSREQALDTLARSQFEQAHAVRLAGMPGRRWIGLDLLQQSAALGNRTKPNAAPQPESAAPHPIPVVAPPSLPELRSEAVAMLLVNDGRIARRLPGFTHAVSPDGRFAASAWIAPNFQGGGLEGGKASVREVATGNRVWEPIAKQSLSLAAVSPNGQFALAYRAFGLGGGDSSVLVWDLETNRERFTLPAPANKLSQIQPEISPEGRWILALHSGGDVAKSFPRSGADRQRSSESSSSFMNFAASSPVRMSFGAAAANMLSPDQEWIGDVWNSETGKRHFQIYGPSTVECSAFSPDGRYLAIGMRNGAIRIWDANAAQELFDWRPATGPAEAAFAARHLAFTADSTALAIPDSTSPLLHILNLAQLGRELAGVSLGW